MDDKIKTAINLVRFGSHVNANVLADECERLEEYMAELEAKIVAVFEQRDAAFERINATEFQNVNRLKGVITELEKVRVNLRNRAERAELRAAGLERRLSEYECPQHPEPQFGECDECDKHAQDEEWRNPKL